jgi:hypothetical protein
MHSYFVKDRISDEMGKKMTVIFQQEPEKKFAWENAELFTWILPRKVSSNWKLAADFWHWWYIFRKTQKYYISIDLLGLGPYIIYVNLHSTFVDERDTIFRSGVFIQIEDERVHPYGWGSFRWMNELNTGAKMIIFCILVLPQQTNVIDRHT